MDRKRHLPANELRLRDAGEAARLAGDDAAFWRLWRALLLAQARRLAAERQVTLDLP